MFCKVLENNKDICKELLELILGKKVKDIRYPQKQKVIDITSDGKGIRLDVYLEDDENTVYNIEMQTTVSKELPKRSRYYQGMIDLNLIEKGAEYKELRKSYVIFLCTKNPFDGVLHKYSFENICNENHALKLNDATTKIFLTPDGTADDVSDAMKAFLSFMVGSAPSDELTEKLDNAVETARKSEKWRLEFMTLLMRDKEKFAEGRAEGRAEGLAEGNLKTTLSFYRKGRIGETEAAEELGITKEEFLKLLEEQSSVNSDNQTV